MTVQSLETFFATNSEVGGGSVEAMVAEIRLGSNEVTAQLASACQLYPLTLTVHSSGLEIGCSYTLFVVHTVHPVNKNQKSN